MQFWGYSQKTTLNHAGEDDTEATPVPIPNTEVKLSCAESTSLVTDWEDRFRRLHFFVWFFILIILFIFFIFISFTFQLIFLSMHIITNICTW